MSLPYANSEGDFNEFDVAVLDDRLNDYQFGVDSVTDSNDIDDEAA